MKNTPVASVIVVTADGPEALAPVIERLQSQDIADRLELIVAVPEKMVASFDDMPTDGFADVRVIAADLGTSARARAAAIHATRTPVVIMAEDHAFPLRDDWARRNLDAHNGACVGVGPRMRNANPGTLTSWVSLFLEYGEWANAGVAGPVRHIAGHNSSYKTGVLKAYGDGLAEIIEDEWVLHDALAANGHVLWYDPEIEVAHLNFSRLPPAILLHFLGGWMFAARRSLGWGLSRRLLYGVSFPAIWSVRMTRYLSRHVISGDDRAMALRAFPLALCLGVVNALGEACGYWFGECGRRGIYTDMEFGRWKNLTASDQDLAVPGPKS